ncbi:MAG: hypothetical protein MSG64_07990 [Pyrinomonadaceae bacterium MAG19_C2-C3]|nr:hypothetical protein [Pyrinomonadaceae bacterium MAG19_C2-C3]
MNKYAKLIAAALVLCAGGGVVMWMSARSSVKGAAAVMPNDNTYVHPFDKINKKAKAAKNNKEESVKEMTDEIIDTLTLPRVPFFIKDKMKDRLARAEKNYRTGKKGGISEDGVVKMVNELAGKFNVPEYVKTNHFQVRTARVSLLASLPDLTTTKTDKLKKGDKKILGLMSPAEAIAVSMYLLQQKMVNEAWQVTPEEFVANLHQKQLERWQAQRNQKSSAEQTGSFTANPKGEFKLRGELRPKRDAVLQAIDSGAANMNPAELSGLADAALDILGVER